MEWDYISNIDDDLEDDQPNTKQTRAHNDETLGIHRSTPHSCTGKCKGLDYCGVEKYHPQEKCTYQNLQKYAQHKKLAKSIKKHKDFQRQLNEKKQNGVVELVDIITSIERISHHAILLLNNLK